MPESRVANFAIFENPVFAITSRILRILTEHIDSICSLESRLFFGPLCSNGILNILEVIAKTRFSKIAKCLTLSRTTFDRHFCTCKRDHQKNTSSVELASIRVVFEAGLCSFLQFFHYELEKSKEN